MKMSTETVCTQSGDRGNAAIVSTAAYREHLTVQERARQHARDVRIQILSAYRQAKRAFCWRARRISFAYAYQWKAMGVVKAEIKGELLQSVAEALEGVRPLEALASLRELLCRSLRREMPWEPQPVSGSPTASARSVGPPSQRPSSRLTRSSQIYGLNIKAGPLVGAGLSGTGVRDREWITC